MRCAARDINKNHPFCTNSSMSMRRHHRRLRLLQRRYARKGRRKAPPDRPPGGLKLRPPRKHPRTYNFNTFPPTGATLSQSDYTLYIHSTALTLYDKRLTRFIQNKKYLRQQRMLYYQEIGLPYKHTLPKHESQKNLKPSQAAQQLSDQLQDQLADYYLPNPTTYDSNLPPDPSHWPRDCSLLYNDPTLLHIPPPNPPVIHHPFATCIIVTAAVRTCIKYLTSRFLSQRQSLCTNSNAYTAFKNLLYLVGLFLVITPSGKKVEHNNTFHDQNFNFNCKRDNSNQVTKCLTNCNHGLTAANHSSPSTKLLPPPLQNESNITITAHTDWPTNHKTRLHHSTSTKNKAGLCKCISTSSGKLAHSL